MKITQTHIFVFVLFLCLFVSTVSLHNEQLKISELQMTIDQQQEKIIKLENDNTINIQNCEKIVKIDNKIILDLAGMFKKLDIYYEQPDLMILDASVIMSSAERNIEKKNELLDQLGIEYNEPTYNLNN